MLPDIDPGETIEHYSGRLDGYLTAAHLVPGAKGPADGGCWYCWTAEDGLVFSIEFDTYLHLICLERFFKANPTDEEALIFQSEFHRGNVH